MERFSDSCGLEIINIISEMMIANSNCRFIAKEVKWLETIILTRLKLYFRQKAEYDNIFHIIPPDTEGEKGEYPEFIKKHSLNFEERVCLILSFVPILKPQILDSFNIKNSDTGKRFVEFGCMEMEAIQILLPTFETLLFLLSSDDLEDKIEYTNSISKSMLFRNKIILLEQTNGQIPLNYSILNPALSSVELLINETHYQLEFSTSFPATRITTSCTWEDLILNEHIIKQIDEIKTWIEYGDRILEDWNLKKIIKPGYRVLFYGASGTGKTFTAALLGKYTNKEVYRIDLSLIISKYIGETEKNLSNIFDKAENRNCILFFDEADALFGKRTNISDAHDRYANQEISYLLQRIENYNGLVVLSTNFKKNIDDAFIRRFQSIIHFSTPQTEERLKLWKKNFSPQTELDKNIELEEISAKYDLTGGSIVNVVQYCSLMAMKHGSNVIRYDDLLDGIRKEYQKAGKTIS